MADEKPQGQQPQTNQPQSQPTQPPQEPTKPPNPNVKPPSLVIVQEGFSPVKETKKK